MRRAALALACAAVLLAPPASAADILGAAYDAQTDELVVDIAYRGTHPNHEFFLLWDSCKGEAPARTAARLVDRQGQDVAREDFRVRERLSLEGLPCRPAQVTLRLGLNANHTVYIPAPPK